MLFLVIFEYTMSKNGIIAILLFFSQFHFLAFTQSNLEYESVKIGEDEVDLVYQKGNFLEGVLFLNLHEDEQTSIEAVRKYNGIKQYINFMYLCHSGERRIEYFLEKEWYSVDPNRIFTEVGITKTLNDRNNYSDTAASAISNLSERILDRVRSSKIIVALHNNTENEYSIESYKPEGNEAQNTAKLYINPEKDPDDFVYTTDSVFFERIKDLKMNVILQDNQDYVDDGSLSVYCGANGIRYLNIEAQHGHLIEQRRMIHEIVKMLYFDSGI